MKSSWVILAEALSGNRKWGIPEEYFETSPFLRSLASRFPDGNVPWPWVQKLLEKHGVPLPLSGEDEEDAAKYGIRMGQPATVAAIFMYLDY